jgi:hypothetical protein
MTESNDADENIAEILSRTISGMRYRPQLLANSDILQATAPTARSHRSAGHADSFSNRDRRDLASAAPTISAPTADAIARWMWKTDNLGV